MDDDNSFQVPVGESQDSDDDEPTIGSFWNSLTTIITENIEQNKDKKGKGKV